MKTMTMRKSALFLVVMMVLSILMSFGTAFAEDDNGQIPTIEVGANGIEFKGNDGFGKGNQDDTWNKILLQGRKFVIGVSGIGALAAIAVFIVSFMKLGASAGNPQARSQALSGIMWSGIAAAGLGSVTLITGLFYNGLKEK